MLAKYIIQKIFFRRNRRIIVGSYKCTGKELFIMTNSSSYILIWNITIEKAELTAELYCVIFTMSKG